MNPAAVIDRLAASEGADVGAVVRMLRTAFAAALIEGALQEARMLAGHVLGLDLTGLTIGADRPVAAADRQRLVALARRRLTGEPVQRLIGSAGFWGLDFALSAETLVPRADTETLVGVVLAASERDAALSIADLGVGSGAILVALLHERPHAIGLGSDLSRDALATARANARRNGVGDRALMVCASYGEALALGRFDLVVSNPPYIASDEIATLDVEVRAHDPARALDGGVDGLDGYRALVPQAAAALKPGGLLALEIGWTQGAAVSQILARCGFEAIAVTADLAGRDRVVSGRARCGKTIAEAAEAPMHGK